MRFISIILAGILLAASVAVMYPDMLFALYDRNEVYDVLNNVTDDENLFETLGFENFPFYTDVSEKLSEYVPVLNGVTQSVPDTSNQLSELVSQDDLLQKLYSFFIISLLSIPIYMILRLIPFGPLYSMCSERSFIFKPFAYGLTACTCSIVTVTATWFMYHTFIYHSLFNYILDKFSNISKPEITLSVTNILIIIVGAITVIGLLKTTLFRGSFINSIMMAVLRSVIFVVSFAAINTFIYCDTLRVVCIGAVFIILIGILDMIIEPASKKH